MGRLRAILYVTLPLFCNATLATTASTINEQLEAQKLLRTIPCEQLSIFSLRTTLSQLLSTKKSQRASSYPLYSSEADMKEVWAALPGVKPGDNPESSMLKHAHCHEAVMWFTQHLSLKEQIKFSTDHFLPLLPTKELHFESYDALSKFYKSKVTCSECLPDPSNATRYGVDHVNQQLQAWKDLRVTPCEQLSIFSIRVVLKELLSAKESEQITEYPMYKTEADMKRQWAALPGVQPGDTAESRLVKFAHCHEAVMWFTQHLTREEQSVFSQRSFLPLLPKAELPLVGPPSLTKFYAAKVKCPQCGLDTTPSVMIDITI